MTFPDLTHISSTTWKDVFATWSEREGVRKEWQRCATEKGWESWEAWRSAWVDQFRAADRAWERYRIDNPMQTVPQFLVGPTQSWQAHFPPNERNQHTFATLIERVSYADNEKVQGIMSDFPSPTEFIGFALPDQTIMLLEGHHRATALALATQHNRPLTITELPTIALTAFTPKDIATLNAMLERGSAK